MVFHWPWANRLALIVLVGWIGYAALGPNVFGSRPWPVSVDYRLIYDFSHHVVAKKSYPVKHAYPPPAIVVNYAFAQPPFSIAAAIHMCLLIAAAVGCWWILVRTLRLQVQNGAWVFALIAFAASSLSWSWDLRMQNWNLMFLLVLLVGAAGLAAQRDVCAGCGFALSVSFKLFSVLVIPYLAWKGHWRALRWTIAGLVVLWVGLPAVVFGSGFVDVYRDWLRQMANLGGGGADLRHPILISLYNSAAWITESDPQAMRWIVTPFQLAWFGLGLVGAFACRRRKDVPGDAFGMLTDISLLILGPLAVSPYLETYHLVAFAVPALLLALTAFDAGQSRWLRGLAFAGLIFAVLVAKIPHPWPMRGLIVNIQLLFAMATAVTVASLRRPGLGVQAQVETPQESAPAVLRAA